MYFKAILEIKNRKEQIDERVMFIQATDIIKAMDITKKIRYSKFKTILPINHETYMKGVDMKYTNTSDPPRS